MAILSDIKSMKIQGATNIAIRGLGHLLKYSKTHGFGRDFEREASRLCSARPTAVVLYNSLEMLKRDATESGIMKIIAKLKNDRILIARNGERLLKSGFRVHTHCHSTDVTGIIKLASMKKRLTVVVDETRPMMQGKRTLNDLRNLRNVSIEFIVDSAAGIAISGSQFQKDDIIIVGSDAMRKEGFANKIGTYLIALAAKENNVPLFVAASTMKLDCRKKFTIEQRPEGEVLPRKFAKGIKVMNPAFEITPWKYVKGVITEAGIKRPQSIKNMISKGKRKSV